MRSPKPPALATWILEHVTPRGKNEALTGDLLEEFGQRRSVAWYWRQVLGAVVVSLSGEMRAHWVGLSVELGLAWVWTYYSFFHLIPLLPEQVVGDSVRAASQGLVVAFNGSPRGFDPCSRSTHNLSGNGRV
jgi:hypothetical protein